MLKRLKQHYVTNKHFKGHRKSGLRDLHTRINNNSTNEKCNKDTDRLLLNHGQVVDLIDKLTDKHHVQLGKQLATTAADFTT